MTDGIESRMLRAVMARTMSNPIPLPAPAAWQRLVNDPDDAPHFYWEECSKWEAENCTPKSDLRQLYTADQMRAHAAAVSAAKDAEIAALRAEAAQLREYLDTAQRRAAALGDEVAKLRHWIRDTGLKADICTRNILGEVCPYCQCKRAARKGEA